LKESKVQNPSVSIVIPVYNEKEYIERCLEALLQQDYPNITEIICVDGRSEDGTPDIIRGLQKDFPKIRLLDNPERVQTFGLNIGIKEAVGETIAIMDAHASFASDYIRRCVELLIETKAGCVGGAARTVPGDSLISKLIVFAHESRFGIGVAKFRKESSEGWTDTVWPGFYWRRIYDEVGFYRPELKRSEDNELNARLRAHGYGIYISPKIRAYYFPRRDLKGLWRQNFANGNGVMQTLFANRQALGIRHFIPFLFVISLLGLLLISPFYIWGKISLAALIGSYSVGSILFSLQTGLKHGMKYSVLMPVIFFIIHLSYGLGSLRGLPKYCYNRLINKI